MSLKDFVIPRKTVTCQGGDLSVRGLSLNDVSFVMRDYLGELENLYRTYRADEEAQKTVAVAEGVKFAITVVKESPKLVAQLIVMASDEEQQLFDIALKMPITSQVEILRTIFELTFEEAGGAKKFVDSLAAMVGATSSSMTV